MMHVFDLFLVAIGLKVIDVVVRERLVVRVVAVGVCLFVGFGEIWDCFECVGDVRGCGLLVGFEVVSDKTSKKFVFELGAVITRCCFELGLLMNIIVLRGMGGVFRIVLLLMIIDAELDLGFLIFD